MGSRRISRSENDQSIKFCLALAEWLVEMPVDPNYQSISITIVCPAVSGSQAKVFHTICHPRTFHWRQTIPMKHSTSYASPVSFHLTATTHELSAAYTMLRHQTIFFRGVKPIKESLFSALVHRMTLSVAKGKFSP